MASSSTTYFSLIHDKLYHNDKANYGRYFSKFKQYRLDIRILQMLCSCLDYNTTNGESLTSLMTHLKLIWVHNNDLETWPAEEIQDFDPLTFRLDEKIEQSKPLIEQCCQILLQHSTSLMQMQMSSTNLDTKEFIGSVFMNVSHLHLYNRPTETVLFKNQIEILQKRLYFLFDSLLRVRGCMDSIELSEYRNFVDAFSYYAACLGCLYWAKEANEETAMEMNIALFDMLQKTKLCVVHVIPSYFVVLKHNNLLKFGETVYEGQDVARFVDFFFEQTSLDFMILREPLILLFTFLADWKNNNDEDDLVRSQIHALLLKHAYVHLPNSEMQEDFSRDFMIKTDILTSRIIQLYCGVSDVKKMNYIYFASLRRELDSFQYQPQAYLYLTEIRFLRALFLPCFETWDDSDEETRVHLRSVVTSLQRIWGLQYNKGLLSCRFYNIRTKDRELLLELELKEKFQLSKKEICAWLVSLSHCSFHCRPSTSNKILEFLDSILFNMSDLVDDVACEDDVAFKKQIEILEEKLLFLKNLLKLATNCADSKNLDEFIMLAQVFANNAACLLYLYWVKEANDEILGETNLMLSNMLQKIKPDTPDVARTYIGTLKAICLQPYDPFLLEQATTSFVDYFFEDLVAPWKNDFQILRNEVIFLLTFVQHHHHPGNAGEIVCSQLDVLFNDDVYDLLPFDDMEGDFSEKKVGLTDFMLNVGTKNAVIRECYCKFPDLSVFNFPRIIGQGFLDCLIQKLRNLMERIISDQKLAPFAKEKIKTIEEELLFLTPIFDHTLELKDQNDAWLEVVNVVYLAEHAISLCLVFYHLIWHCIPYLWNSLFLGCLEML